MVFHLIIDIHVQCDNIIKVCHVSINANFIVQNRASFMNLLRLCESNFN